jgi:XTP/dITP diphosphohydrolase
MIVFANMKLILATKNANKVEELRAMLEGMNISLSSLLDHLEIKDIEENGNTFEENALIKARAVCEITGEWALADDSGLVVDALGGAPGIYSSRYAGREKDYPANNEKLLREMEDIPDDKRQAAFVCVMTLVGPNGEEYTVEGRCEGEIARSLTGDKGFGYDPLFYLPDYHKTMAELPMDEKNKISHRGRALVKIKDVLLDILGKER